MDDPVLSVLLQASLSITSSIPQWCFIPHPSRNILDCLCSFIPLWVLLENLSSSALLYWFSCMTAFILSFIVHNLHGQFAMVCAWKEWYEVSPVLTLFHFNTVDFNFFIIYPDYRTAVYLCSASNLAEKESARSYNLLSLYSLSCANHSPTADACLV